MRILLVHQNFPGQFKHLAPALIAAGHEVAGLTMKNGYQLPGLRMAGWAGASSTSAQHPWARDFETKTIRAHGATHAAARLREDGFNPDVIVGHPGWGDTLFLKHLWPSARYGMYCELFYRTRNTDDDFDPEFPLTVDPVERMCHVNLRNLPQRLNMAVANAGLSPTRFQAESYPAPFRDRITVIHDGIDTDAIRPADFPELRLGSGVTLNRDTEFFTFVSRTLEPYRGYHSFMRALPELLRRRPNARAVIVGAEGTSYGAAPPTGKSWKQVFLEEVQDQLDMSRVHFVGALPYPIFLNLLGLSRLHIYLTYPFVLSWSLLETMALGTPVLGSDTAPVREVIRHGETGWLTPFTDPQALAEQAAMLLADEALRSRLAATARDLVRKEYDLHSVCLPRQIEWIDELYHADPIIPELD